MPALFPLSLGLGQCMPVSGCGWSQAPRPRAGSCYPRAGLGWADGPGEWLTCIPPRSGHSAVPARAPHGLHPQVLPDVSSRTGTGHPGFCPELLIVAVLHPALMWSPQCHQHWLLPVQERQEGVGEEARPEDGGWRRSDLSHSPGCAFPSGASLLLA